MRRRVHEAAAQLGYQPDFLAQSFRRGATSSVGFVLRDISSPLLAEIALGAETTLRGGGYSMLVLNSEADPLIDAEHIRLLERRRVDGVLISLAGEEHRQTLAALNELSVPSVLIDRDVPDAVNSSSLLVDHESAMLAVVSHLAELGHRVIGLAGGPLAVRPGREGARAFRSCATELGLTRSWSLDPSRPSTASLPPTGCSGPPTPHGHHRRIEPDLSGCALGGPPARTHGAHRAVARHLRRPATAGPSRPAGRRRPAGPSRVWPRRRRGPASPPCRWGPRDCSRAARFLRRGSSAPPNSD